MAPRNTPIAVEIPSAVDDRPAWTKVGIVAALGFAIGIAWPKLTETRIAPSPPNDERSSATRAPSTAISASAASTQAPAASASVAVAAPSAREQPISVGPGTIAKCRDAKRGKGDDCGSLALDPLVVPRVEQLAKCPAASGVTGKLSLGLDIDFAKKTVRVLQGKSTTLPRSAAEGVMKCASAALADVKLENVSHDHQRYTVFYAATFQAPGTVPGAGDGGGEVRTTAASPTETPQSGTATVVWERAIVRDRPKSQTIAARIQRDTKVKLLAKDGSWYRVQYGSGPSREGWVYREALGL